MNRRKFLKALGIAPTVPFLLPITPKIDREPLPSELLPGLPPGKGAVVCSGVLVTDVDQWSHTITVGDMGNAIYPGDLLTITK